MRRGLEAEVLNLKAKVDVPSTPSQHKFQDLTRKLEYVERRMSQRESELSHVIEEGRQHARMELSRLRALHEEEMRAKDSLIHSFRAELDGLLGLVGRLQGARGSAIDMRISAPAEATRLAVGGATT
ncbi:unnamed protein product [Discosporangium mesarthrocarpum]